MITKMSSEVGNDYILAIGLMTGNSLDGVDGVLSKFGQDGSITDLASVSIQNSNSLISSLRQLREAVQNADGDITKAEKSFKETDKVHMLYLETIIQCVNEILIKAKLRASDIDLIGFHGQTCSHLSKKYTVQLGDGQALADKVGIPVVYDFRSDDIMNGGEGAPLAPMHHKHLAASASKFLPLAFCNAGNTGNISLISNDRNSGKEVTLGWDSGPFNHFPDFLMRTEKSSHYDIDGKSAEKGKVNLRLLEALFSKSAQTESGENYYEKKIPKSSDPAWYKTIPELTDKNIPFEDRLRTAEYLSVYVLFHSLSLIPSNVIHPMNLALCGGGWNNSLIIRHLKDLIAGDETQSPVLPQHRSIFGELASKKLTAEKSSFYGFDGKAMEARIFADAAVSRIKEEPFSLPEITGVKIPTVLGLIKFPKKDRETASQNLKNWMKKFNTKIESKDLAQPTKWSRASAGWV